MSEDWLRVEKLCFGYPETGPILRDVSFEVTVAEPVVAVVGSSGIGKSTLLGLLGGWLMPESGRILVDGKSVTRPDPSRAVVFQDHNLLPWMTVMQNVAFALKPAGRQGDRDAILDALGQFGLADKAGLYPSQLSGGMKQRVGLARSLIVDPDILLLDEPFSALDYTHREKIVAQLEALVHDRATRIVLVTHDLHVAVRLARKVIVLGADGLTAFPVATGHEPRTDGFRFSAAFRDVLTRIEAHFQGRLE